MRNFINFDKKCRILHAYTNKKSNLQSIILEVTAEIHKYIKENNNRIFVGYQNCKVFDIINVAPCIKCGRHGHNKLKCRNEPACLKCAGNHKTINCSGEMENKCINCCYTNAKYGTHYDTKHLATDSHACKILQGKIQKLVDATDYIIKPTIQRHVAKVEYQPMVKGTSNLSPSKLRLMNENIVAKQTEQKIPTQHND